MLLKLFFMIKLITLCKCTIILPPVNNNGEEVGLLFVPGSEMKASDYQEPLKLLQYSLPNKLWIAILEFPNDLPLENLTFSKINDALTNLKSSGFHFTSNTPFFFAGHSIGAILIQDYIQVSNKEVKIAGIILNGACINRKYNDYFRNIRDLSILSLNGELDGLNRITRVAESFYFDEKDSEKFSSFKKITIVVPGMNHFQFLGQGLLPQFIKNNDLQPEINNSDALDKVHKIVSSFMKVVLNKETNEDTTLLNDYLTITSNLVKPIINALEMEGYYNFVPPCYIEKNKNCTYGSKWTSISQQIMASSNVKILNIDQFTPAAQIFPDPLPTIANKCPQPYMCTLNTTTVSENIYSSNDPLNVVVSPITASEIRSKLSSRQSLLLAATGTTFDFTETDGGNLCGDINQESINWAMSIVPKETLKRYLDKGTKIRIGKDINYSYGGPLWIWTSMRYNNQVDSATKEKYLEVKAPLMKFSVNFPIKLSAGFHFCKVLSPARVVEHIYVDSLKQ